MRSCFAQPFLPCCVAATLAFASGAGAALIGIYRNPMENKGQLAQILKLSGERCARGGSEGAFTITIGKATKECSYRTPVLGRDLEIGGDDAPAQQPQTPKSVQRSVYLALDLRAGGGARYQLAVYPLQRKAQLRKFLHRRHVEYLEIEKDVQADEGHQRSQPAAAARLQRHLRPRKGPCRSSPSSAASCRRSHRPGGGRTEGRASRLLGRRGQERQGRGGSVDDVVVRVPNPFE